MFKLLLLHATRMIQDGLNIILDSLQPKRWPSPSQFRITTSLLWDIGTSVVWSKWIKRRRCCLSERERRDKWFYKLLHVRW
jgi:hypothetical protein